MIALHQVTAAVYLVASLAAVLGLALPDARMRRGSAWLLMLGVAIHTLAFAAGHLVEKPPPLTTVPAAVSLMVWMAVLFFVFLMRRPRIAGLIVILAPAAFLGVFGAALGFEPANDSVAPPSASWSHLHILLSAAGLALLAVAGIAGLCFVTEHRRLKRKRPVFLRLPLPSLEALDRVNRLCLGLGFLLLTLAVVTGVLWVHATSDKLWPGTAHANWTLVAWGIYAVLAWARFGARHGSRESAILAMAGFGFLLFAVVGVGALT